MNYYCYRKTHFYPFKWLPFVISWNNSVKYQKWSQIINNKYLMKLCYF